MVGAVSERDSLECYTKPFLWVKGGGVGVGENWVTCIPRRNSRQLSPTPTPALSLSFSLFISSFLFSFLLSFSSFIKIMPYSTLITQTKRAIKKHPEAPSVQKAFWSAGRLDWNYCELCASKLPGYFLKIGARDEFRVRRVLFSRVERSLETPGADYSRTLHQPISSRSRFRSLSVS